MELPCLPLLLDSSILFHRSGRRGGVLDPKHINTDRFSGAFNPRPVSMAFGANSAGHTQNLSGSTFNPGLENVEMELENLLADEDGLNDEVTMGLDPEPQESSAAGGTTPPSDR